MVVRAEVSRGLEHALDRGEISAWFQPQIDVPTGRIVAAEALCRWNHSDWGAIAPQDFIPVAEEDGTIAEIGRFMAVQALEVMAGSSIDVSVNVSPAQLHDSTFTSWLEQFIGRARRRARRLTLEITEGRHIVDAPAVIARLDRLRRIGVGIAIDDFGAGEASLTQLKRLHATELKLDRALVIDDSRAATAVMAQAVDVAHAAGVRVVAEGIETTEQLEKVTSMGCDRAQGYLFARPMPRAQLARVLRSR